MEGSSVNAYPMDTSPIASPIIFDFDNQHSKGELYVLYILKNREGLNMLRRMEVVLDVRQQDERVPPCDRWAGDIAMENPGATTPVARTFPR